MFCPGDTPTVAAHVPKSVENDLAQKQGVAPEVLALNALRERFLTRRLPLEPQDEWERGLLAIGTDCGVSLTNEALSSEGLYE